MGSATPTERQPPQWYANNPQARYSFSRLATFKRCPGWFRHQYLHWHKSPIRCVTEVGHVVQRSLERVMDGRPADSVTLEELTARAEQRLELCFTDEWNRKRDAFVANPSAIGGWDLDFDRFFAMAKRGLAHHIHEVTCCLRGIHPTTGVKLPIPPVSTVAEAWQRAKPWHVDPDAPPFSQMEVVPGGWFQGEPDLVYGWTGGRRIIDLKASAGSSPFSGEIDHQLKAYAYLEQACGRGLPEGLEAWFLGREERYECALPSPQELEELERSIHELIDLAGSERGFGAWSLLDFEPKPEHPPGFEPAEGDASAWCATCPAALVCPSSARSAPAIGEGVGFDQLPKQGPFDLEGEVAGFGQPNEKRPGKWTWRFTLLNESGAMSFSWDASSVEGMIRAGMHAGAHVRLTNLRPYVLPSGDILVYDSAATRLQILS